jgi:hypothetical protein
MRLRFVRTSGLCAVALLATGVIAIGQQTAAEKWQPGQYRGLITGKSTMEDVVRVLGNPSWRGKPIEVPDETDAAEWNYNIDTPQGKCCDLYFRSGVLQSIDLKLRGLLLNEAEKQFGGKFERVRFRTEEDTQATGSGQMCEDLNGDSALFVNPKKGISLWIDPAGVLARQAVFSATRPGSQHCIPAQPK